MRTVQISNSMFCVVFARVCAKMWSQGDGRRGGVSVAGQHAWGCGFDGQQTNTKNTNKRGAYGRHM